MKPIDEIFRNSETEKSLEVRPELWRRLERTLDIEKDDQPIVTSKKSRLLIRPWMIAASFIVLAGFSMLWRSSNQYLVEDLSADTVPEFAKEELVFDLDWSLIPSDYNG